MSTASEREIEQEIKDKGLIGPRIRPDNLDQIIKQEDYYVFPGTANTICLLTLINGFTLVGHSSCVSIENFDEEIGRKIARSNARDKIWGFLGYQLKEDLYKNSRHDD